MAEIWFYQLGQASAEDVLPQLLRRGLERQLRLSIECLSRDRVGHWSEVLWRHEDVGFLPHGFEGEPNLPLQPILIASDAGNANGSTFRFYVDGALPGADTDYERASVLVDSRDADGLAAARQAWKKFKTDGASCRSFRQDDAGNWRDASADG